MARKVKDEVGTVARLLLIGLLLGLMVPAGTAQSGQSPPAVPAQSPAPANSEQQIPDAPSTVQPPEPKLPIDIPPEPAKSKPKSNQPVPFPVPGEQPLPQETRTPPPPMPPVQTVPAGTRPPRNQLNPKEDLYTISVTTNMVQVPVLVKDSSGRRVDGLLPQDFIVKENGQVQKLTYFSSDPFVLSVALVIDTNVADVVLQKIHQTYSSLVGAFSPYDEVALYTYSSTVTQVTDYSGRPEKLTSALNELKLVRGRNNGPPVLGGPLGPQGPTVNGAPVGGPTIQPVITPPREAHVLNDAILRAAIDLSKRDRTRRKVIFVISDGWDIGSRTSYRDVLKVLETHGIQVKAVVVDTSALPGYKQAEKFHLWGQGHNDILPRYCRATGGGDVFTELSRNAMEEAYAEITSEARNQYTLAYSPKAFAGAPAYRSIEVLVDRKGLNIYAKAGYYPVPSSR